MQAEEEKAENQEEAAPATSQVEADMEKKDDKSKADDR